MIYKLACDSIKLVVRGVRSFDRFGYIKLFRFVVRRIDEIENRKPIKQEKDVADQISHSLNACCHHLASVESCQRGRMS